MIKQKAYAKLDLAISIDSQKLPDGYYPVNYIDCQINLFDELLFEKKEKGIEIICNNPQVPKNKDNFIYKAAYLLQNMSNNKKPGVKITLNKQIPIKAGFGGGSSDAAATIKALEKLWKIKLTNKQLKDFARNLGKDFYYSLYGNLSEVIGEGRNYQVVPILRKFPEFWLLIVIPDEEKSSTAWVYQHLNKKNVGKNQNKYKNLKQAILEQKRVSILNNFFNDFENSVLSLYPAVNKIKQDLISESALKTIMAGAGLAVVGFFENKINAQKAKQKLANKYRQIIISQIIN